MTCRVLDGITRNRSFFTSWCLAYFFKLSVCNFIYFGKLFKSSLAGLFASKTISWSIISMALSGLFLGWGKSSWLMYLITWLLHINCKWFSTSFSCSLQVCFWFSSSCCASFTLSSLILCFSFSRLSCKVLVDSIDFLSVIFLFSSSWRSIVFAFLRLFLSISISFSLSCIWVFSVLSCSKELILGLAISIFFWWLFISTSFAASFCSNSEILFRSVSRESSRELVSSLFLVLKKTKAAKSKISIGTIISINNI